MKKAIIILFIPGHAHWVPTVKKKVHADCFCLVQHPLSPHGLNILNGYFWKKNAKGIF